MKTASDAKKTLEALLAGEPLPFAEDALQKARALAQAPSDADPAAVAQLPEPLALAVLEAAVRTRAYPLANALSESPVKSLAKAAKKTLYQLRSLGFAPLEKKPQADAAPPPPRPEEPLASLVSAITGNGERALIVARPVRGGVELAQAVLSDEHGVVELRAQEVSRGTYRKVLRDARRPGAAPTLLIPFEEARELLAEAAGANLRSHAPFPEGLDAALRHLGAAPADRPPEVPPPEEGDAALAARGAALHDEPEIAVWLPPHDELRKLALKAEEIATSALYIDEHQRAEQLARTVRSLAEGFFTPAIRQLYGRRLWAMGDLYERLGRNEAGRLAKAEARRLYHAAPGLFSPFAVRLFEKVLELTARASGQQRAEPERATAESERRSPGGLILP
ncbi:MAG TPA: hypothetical protein VE782_10345 [Myxococcaceae bacterium]|nr:hypothetical protein [Myxococcaceae bacterium]